jgi:hypothetical protein
MKPWASGNLSREINWELFMNSSIFKVLQGGLLLLLLLPRLSCVGTYSGQIRSVSVSSEGKLIAVDFRKGNTPFIYKITVDAGMGTR